MHIVNRLSISVVSTDTLLPRLSSTWNTGWISQVKPTHNGVRSESGETRIEIWNPGKFCSTKDVFQSLSILRKRPVTEFELAALGRSVPNCADHYPVVGLGTSWNDPRGFLRSPLLSIDGQTRYAWLAYTHTFWWPQDCFAVVDY